LTPIPGAPPPLQISRKVALVCCKPLINGQLSLEQDYRIQRLVEAMRKKEFIPYMVVFVGSDSATKAMTHFQQIIHAENDDDDDEQQPPHRPKCMAESTPILDGGLDIATKYFKTDLARWSHKLLEKLQMSVGDDDITGGRSQSTTSTTMTTMRRVVVQIQFALVSADYHLCILNDLHVRSPMQSFLKCFDHWDNNLLVDDHHQNRHTSSFAPKRIVVEPSWRYLYASTTGLRYYYPRSSNNSNDSDDDDDDEEETNIAISFCATCYRRVHLLIPVLMNIRAVAQNREFFQRDNYSLLVQVRRAFITDVENMYHNTDDDTTKTLRSVRKYMTALHNMNGSNKSLDVVLDGALLSMGRCSDLVRPAGLFTGSVPTSDFRRAVTYLEHAITQITMACDPDRPFVQQPPTATTAVATTTTTFSTSNTVVSLCRWIDEEQQNGLVHEQGDADDSSTEQSRSTRPAKKQSLLSRRQKRITRKPLEKF
jgi:hypothetical protein